MYCGLLAFGLLFHCGVVLFHGETINPRER